MKRKAKRYDDGGKVYDKEDEGLFGGKVKYREEDGRKYTAAPSNPFDRNPQEQRYYSVGDVKNKLSGLFGGKSDDEPKKSTTMPSGYEKLDATEGNARTRQISDYIKKSEPKAEEPAKPTGKTVLNEEADIEEKPKKKAAPKPAPKATEKVGKGYEDVTRALKGSEKVGKGYEKLDVRAPEEKYKPGISKERQEAADKAYYAGWKKKPVRSTADIRAGRQVESMKKGGSVKSASARADGCAIRGKTRA
jgi:hypothetical protein